MILGGNLYLTESEIVSMDKLRELLTVPNPDFVAQTKHGYGFIKYPETICFLEKKGEYFVAPRNIPKELISVDGFTDEDDLRSLGLLGRNNPFDGELRAYQKTFLNSLPLDTENDFVLEADCGTGKTVMGCWIISYRRSKTLVVTTTIPLAHQWEKEVKRFLTSASVVVGKNNADYKDCDVYILNIDRLKAKDYPSDFYHNFGLVLMDEGHRYGSATYQPEIGLFHAIYRTALTATFRRDDGMHKILACHFGKVYKMKSPHPQATVIPVAMPTIPEDKEFIFRGKVSYSRLDNWAAENTLRNEYLLRVMNALAEGGRTVLFLSKRRAVLENWNRYFKLKGYKTALIVGGMSDKELDKTMQYAQENAQLIFGIAQLAKEGLDIDRLDTLVLHHPIKDLKQPIGRIRRFREGKKKPICIFPYDDVAAYRGIFYASKRFADGAIYEKTHSITKFLASDLWK